MKLKGVLIILCFWQAVNAQQSDFTFSPDTSFLKKKWHQTEAFRIGTMPVLLIGYGLAVKDEHRFISGNSDVKQWRQNYLADFETDLDDYMPSASLFLMYGLDVVGVESSNHWITQSVLFFGANALNGLATKKVKRFTAVTRPDGRDKLSFPSAHTSSAFVAAEMLHQEFRDQNVWISVAGYSLASTVGLLRIMNNRHWLSDVAAGAGFGIASVRLTYFVYNHTLKKWGDKLKKKPVRKISAF